jgi:tetratricopeptide (TPR) repeat protein
LAFVTALLWAVHPLQTEAVTYLSQRVESLMGLFYLCSIYCFIRYAELSQSLAKNLVTAKPAFGPAPWAALSVLACLLGMATKEVMVTAPCMIFLYDWIFFPNGAVDGKKGRVGYYLALTGTWLLLGMLVIRAGTRGGTAGFGSGVSWWAYGLTQVWAVAHYLRLVFWPYPLIADYGRILGGSPGTVACDLAVLLFLAGLSAALLWKRSPWGYVGASFFIVLSPSSSVVPIATEAVAEHRMYLPLAAVLAAIVCAAAFGMRALARNLGWNSRTAAIGQGMLVATIAAFLMAATAARNRTYQSVLTFWSDVVEKVPDNAGAWINVGNALEQNGDLPGAEARYREALRLVPGYVDAHLNLANALVRENRPEKAIEHYRDVLGRYPTNEAARSGLGQAAYRAGNAQMEAGRMAAAVDFYQTAVEMKPDFSDAHVNYGGALAELGRNSEAMHEFEAALKLDPGSADIHNNLGGLLAQAGRLAEARIQFEAALKLRPDYREARDNLERVRQLQAMGARP